MGATRGQEQDWKLRASAAMDRYACGDEAAFGELYDLWKPLHDVLDHNYLNEVPGLENPTSEVLAKWIWDRLRPKLPELVQVTLFETCDARCEYTGD